MTTITLDEIKSAQEQVAKMIATFEAEAAIEAAYPITVPFPKVNPGERYVGAIISADGSRRYHLILLPGDNDAASWQDQMKWAESIGGELPDRVEGALLFATLKDQFKAEAYWTREQHAADSNFAWYQYFYYGYQDSYDTGYELRARAVRRSPIE